MSWSTEVNTQRVDGGTLVTVEGDLDMETSAALEQVFRTARREGARTLTVDLSATRCIDSCGVRLLASTARELGGEGGRLVLAGCPSRSARAFTLLGLGHLVAT